VYDAASIREAARILEDRLEAGDADGVVACFSPDCVVELLGVRLRGHDGVRRWLAWVRRHASSIRFEPILIGVEGSALFEEFVVHAGLRDGSRVTSRWAEVLEGHQPPVALRSPGLRRGSRAGRPPGPAHRHPIGAPRSGPVRGGVRVRGSPGRGSPG
jgi:hypothetical protein